MKHLLTLAAMLATLFTPPLQAADDAEEDSGPLIYRSTDKHGNTIFSDEPSKDAQRIRLNNTNRTPSVEPRARPKPAPDDAEQDGYRVTITTPQNESFIPNGLLPTEISINVDPPVLPKHRIEYLLNGERHAIGSSYSATIPRLTPGSHQISARIVDSDDNVIGEPDTVHVTTQWPGSK